MQFKVLSHQYWMSKAIELAKEVNDEIPVAALIVFNDNLIASAVNKTEALNDSTAHAEILVIKEASRVKNNWRLNDCVLYTTLEPCAMCAGAIINSRISKLVFGAYDLTLGACGSKVNLFTELDKQHHIEITGGIFENECSMLLKNFFTSKRIPSCKNVN